jgi:hypothetical protein
MVLFWVWQLTLMEAAPTRFKVPFFGLAAWLIAGGNRAGGGNAGSSSRGAKA